MKYAPLSEEHYTRLDAIAAHSGGKETVESLVTFAITAFLAGFDEALSDDDDGTTRRVVRNTGSSKIHVADVHPGQLQPYRLFGSPFIGAEPPVAAACGVVLRGSNNAAVCMNPGTRVTCKPCARITGVEVAPDDNQAHPSGMTAAEMWAAVTPSTNQEN